MDHLAVGDTLLLTFADLGDRLTGVLVGKKDGRGLVVYADLPDKTLSRIRKNDDVLVQFAFESTLLGFHTRVDAADGKGGSLFLLQWPEAVLDMNLRSEPRAHCLFPGLVRIGADHGADHGTDLGMGRGTGRGTESACLVEDVSESALRIRLRGENAEELRRGLEPGTPVFLDFAPFDPRSGYSARCTLIKTFRSKERSYLVLALAPGDATLKNIMREYVERVLANSH